MECELCGRNIKRGVYVEVQGSLLLVCAQCAKKHGKIVAEVNFEEKRLEREPKITRRRQEIIEEVIPDFGKVIKEAREKLGLTREELAKNVAIAESYLRRIENEEVEPDQKTLRKLEKFLGIKLTRIVEEEVVKGEEEKEEVTLADIVELREKK